MIEKLKNNPFDIVLLDIDMPTISGFDVAEKLQNSNSNLSVIFVTAHSELAYQAYDYQPFSFVYKNDISRLDRVLRRLIHKIELKKQEN